MSKRIDMQGKRFGRLKVSHFVGYRPGSSHWACECDCGEKPTVSGYALRSGHTQSCGCLHSEQLSQRNSSHGLSQTSLYNVWGHIWQRCTNPKDKRYLRYGGRGIKVCSEWKDFSVFWEDMREGYSPDLLIDRIDNDKDYCKENCRWATPKVSGRNKGNNQVIPTPLGKMCIAEAAETFGICANTLQYRIYRGCSEERLLEKPK